LEGFGGAESWICFAKSWAVGRSLSAHTSTRPKTRTDFTELEEIQFRIEAGLSVEEFLVLDRRLHWATYRRHDADQLAAIVAQLWDTTQHYRRAFTQLNGSRRHWTINAEHRFLIEAIKDRDIETGERVLGMHIRRTRIELSQHPELFATTTL